jgi:hypothetical protein
VVTAHPECHSDAADQVPNTTPSRSLFFIIHHGIATPHRLRQAQLPSHHELPVKAFLQFHSRVALLDDLGLSLFYLTKFSSVTASASLPSPTSGAVAQAAHKKKKTMGQVNNDKQWVKSNPPFNYDPPLVCIIDFNLKILVGSRFFVRKCSCLNSQ